MGMDTEQLHDSSQEADSSAYLLLNARRLLWLRAIAIPAPALLLIAAGLVYGYPAPTPRLLLIVVMLLALNAWTWLRLRSRGRFTDYELLAQMLVDVAALTGTLYYSAGASNPFAFFYLLPVMISATALPRRLLWLVTAATLGCYTSLLLVSPPLPDLAPVEQSGPLALHVGGMWIGFIVIALLIAHFIAGISTTLRDRERSLAEARERMLRHERLVALATLAAGAAHELSTPLNTMLLLADELDSGLPADRQGESRELLEQLRSQIHRCRHSLTAIAASAGTSRSSGARRVSAASFLRERCRDTRSLRPEAALVTDIDASTETVFLTVDRSFEQALSNLLDNAIDASPQAVELRAAMAGSQLRVEVLDRGPGPQAITEGKRSGLGFGLEISREILLQAGARLQFLPRPGGGSITRIDLPAALLSRHD